MPSFDWSVSVSRAGYGACPGVRRGWRVAKGRRGRGWDVGWPTLGECVFVSRPLQRHTHTRPAWDALTNGPEAKLQVTPWLPPHDRFKCSSRLLSTFRLLLTQTLRLLVGGSSSRRLAWSLVKSAWLLCVPSSSWSAAAMPSDFVSLLSSDLDLNSPKSLYSKGKIVGCLTRPRLPTANILRLKKWLSPQALV